MEKDLRTVVAALESAGYNAKAQIQEYLLTGDKTYITRNGNARALIANISEKSLRDYIAQNR